MTHAAPSQPPDDAAASGRALTPVPPLLLAGLHSLVAGLLMLAAGRSIVDHAPAWPWIVVCAALVGAVYAVGIRSAAVTESRGTVVVWLALLLASWIVLLILTPVAIYLAFPWFLLLLYLLPRRAGLAALAFVTIVAVAGFGWHQETFTAAMAVGPVLGAAIAIATVFGYQTLQAESERRWQLILELDRARTELAAAQHRAGVLDERERLAREIHDTIAQGLSSIQLLLLAAARALDPNRTVDPVRASDLVEQARHAAMDNLAEARRVVRALAPGDLASSTLPAALRRLCETTSARTGIEVVFHEEGPPTTLATPVEVALLRVAQGALGNAALHSRATRADVTLTVMDAAVTLDIVDDGIGFDVDAPAVHHGDRGGYGIRSMRSRIAELGGQLTVESRPGRGTAISVHVDRVVAVADPVRPS